MARRSGNGRGMTRRAGGRRATIVPAVRQLSTMLDSRTRLVLVALATESVIASALEAGVLVIIATTALAVTSGSGRLTLPIPTSVAPSLDVEATIALAGGGAVLLLLLHLHAAMLASKLSSRVLEATRNEAIDAYAEASWSKQASEREGSLQETVSTLAAQTSALAFAVSQLITSVMAVLALTVGALLVDPIVTMVALVTGAGILVSLRPLLARTADRSQTYVSLNSQFTESVAEWTAVALELTVFGAARHRADQLKRVNRSVSAAMRHAQLSSKVGSLLYRDLAVVLLVLAIGVLQSWSRSDMASTGAAMLLVLRTLAYGQQLNQSLQHLTELQPNLESLVARTEALQRSITPFGDRRVGSAVVLEVRGVSFAYSGRDAVRSVSFHWSRGEMLGVIGPSGSGKSTIVQLICRLRQPDEGAILLDELPYEQYSPDSWVRHMALVPQEPRLIAGTILENIVFYRPWLSREDATQAAAEAQVLDEILELPAGLDTLLGARGLGLSGGQRQRLCIARALASKPSFLVLDEPTSALDKRSEHRIQETLRNLHAHADVGVLIVAHRLSTLSDCDRVIAVQDGCVVADGSLLEATAAIGTGWAIDAEASD